MSYGKLLNIEMRHNRGPHQRPARNFCRPREGIEDNAAVSARVLRHDGRDLLPISPLLPQIDPTGCGALPALTEP